MKSFDRVYFTHIPKTAGNTLKALYGTEDWYTHKGHQKTIEIPENTFHFCFIRNPWDRLVSTYHWVRNHDKFKCKRFYKEYRERGFDKFVKAFHKDPQARMNQTHLIPQYDFIYHNDILIPDYVGKFESFNSELHYLNQLFIENIPDYNSNLKEIPVTNSSPHMQYREYYTDETRDMVAEIYSKDILAFNYSY